MIISIITADVSRFFFFLEGNGVSRFQVPIGIPDNKTDDKDDHIYRYYNVSATKLQDQ